jgi:hypothetical protein
LNIALQQSVEDLQGAIPDVSQPPEVSTQKWEYNLGIVLYDDVCAAEALAPYKDNAVIKSWFASISTALDYNRYTVAVVYGLATCFRTFPQEDWMIISTTYVNCGHRVFDAYAKDMGEQGWEMVGYERSQYTSSGSQYCSGIIVDYGYEVMWKRPKTSE